MFLTSPRQGFRSDSLHVGGRGQSQAAQWGFRGYGFRGSGFSTLRLPFRIRTEVDDLLLLCAACYDARYILFGCVATPSVPDVGSCIGGMESI